ncbi:MAG: NADH-quinone oxidoreductase subunit I [Pseudomonadota bacterium]
MGTINVSKKQGWKERVYLIAILQGMWITLKQFCWGFFLRKSWTIYYPEQKRNYSQRFRGAHFISLDPNKIENCTACYLCQTVCPADCIRIVAEERDPQNNAAGVAKEKKPLSFDIDTLRCCFCGMCEEACPKDAIKLSRKYDLAVLSRKDAVYSLDYLKREVKGRD